MARQSPAEKGYDIPVQRLIGAGRYAKAYAKSLQPNSAGKVRVCFDSGNTSRWHTDSVIHVPQGFKVINEPICHDTED